MIEQYVAKNFKKDLFTEITLKELKFMEIVDTEEQARVKDYIDDLVFALYFDIPIKKVGLKNAEEIKSLCQKNEFYDYINQTGN